MVEEEVVTFQHFSRDSSSDGIPRYWLGAGTPNAEELKPGDAIEVKVRGGVLPAVFSPNATPWIGSAQFTAELEDGQTHRVPPFELRQGMLIRLVRR